MPAKDRARSWFGTIWDIADIQYIKSLVYCTKYIIISAVDTTAEAHQGRQQLHWHAVVVFKTNVARPKTKTAHWEKCRNLKQCIEYCKAKGDPTHISGEEPKAEGPGDINNRFAEFTEACKTMTDRELIDNYGKMYATYTRYAHQVR